MKDARGEIKRGNELLCSEIEVKRKESKSKVE
jgi:hypothetical protein